MKPLRKFLALSASERHLLVSGALWLAAMRLGLWVLPFRTLLSSLPHMVPEGNRLSTEHTLPPEQMGWAVRVASRYVPGTRNCLVQALTAQHLLVRCGHPARLCLGVAKRGEFKSHAWVECEGKIVIGGGGVSGYAQIAAFPRPFSEAL